MKSLVSRVSCLVLIVTMLCNPCWGASITITKFTSDKDVQWFGYHYTNTAGPPGTSPTETVVIGASMGDANAQNVHYIFFVTLSGTTFTAGTKYPWRIKNYTVSSAGSVVLGATIVASGEEKAI